VSHLSNSRLLRRLEQKRGLRRSPYVEAVYAVEREYQAVRGITGFARLLAGTDERQMASVAPSPADSVTEFVSRVDHAPPRSSRLVWSETVRPGRDDILTWDEAMRVPWVDASVEAHQR
jgi:hypothetical protein